MSTHELPSSADHTAAGAAAGAPGSTCEMPQAGNCVVLRGVSWQFYENCLAELGDRPIRLSYYRGTLVMMSPSKQHERYKKAIGRMIETLTEVLNIPIQSAGSTTWRRRARQSGLEADECYYIQREAEVRGLDESDLSVVPPPDLAVEVELSPPPVDRMAIYANLGVPEVWRYDGRRLAILGLGRDKAYHPRRRSACLPMLPPGEVTRFLATRSEMDETKWIRAFRKWVKDALKDA
jgi:Uma2 family endonuclease